MKQFLANIFKRWAKRLENTTEVICETKLEEPLEQTSAPETEEKVIAVDQNKSGNKQKEKKIINIEKAITAHSPRELRDIMGLMEVPIVSLSKNRTAPIIYESPDGSTKIKITPHTGRYIASIYDWDIILFVSSKLQETLNNGSDVPPRTLIIPRHELIKAICKYTGKTTNKELEASLARLQLTGIETTINNEDYRHREGFGFVDRWGYTERKDVKEFRITLSDWLYEITCSKGALLKVNPEYFKITSGLKRFLYRTARKHVGSKNSRWEFSAKTLYDRSGSEREFKKFKHDLKKAVVDNDLPGYFMEWTGENEKEKVCFINKEIIERLSSITNESDKDQESSATN
jgi:plasmid replication initiation protein